MSLYEKIKELRHLTKFPLMECKNALVKSNNDIEIAKKLLEDYAIKKALKLKDREIKINKIFHYFSNNKDIGILIKLGSESDFVINNELITLMISEFGINLVQYIKNNNLKTHIIDINTFLNLKNINDESKKIKDLLINTIAMLGENIKILEIIYIKI